MEEHQNLNSSWNLAISKILVLANNHDGIFISRLMSPRSFRILIREKPSYKVMKIKKINLTQGKILGRLPRYRHEVRFYFKSMNFFLIVFSSENTKQPAH